MSARIFKPVAIVAVAVFAATLFGCGGGGSDKNSASTATTNTTVANAPDRLTIAIRSKMTTMNASLQSAADQLAISDLIDATLTITDDTGAKALPGLAESWTASGDSKSWTFKLRPNLKFSDGSPLTAKDVVASYNFLRKLKTNIYAYTLRSISSVRAAGADEVEFTLSAPGPRFDLIASLPQNAVYPAAKLSDPKAAGKFLDKAPISAGRYILESTSTTKTVLKANPNYWGPKPAVSQLTFLSLPDASARLTQLRGGQVDVAFDIPAQAAPQLTGELHARWQSISTGGTYLDLNTRPSAPTANLKLREAVNAAIDRNQLSKVVYFGKNPPQLGLYPRSSPFYETYLNANADVGKAKSLLAQSGCKSPCKLPITAPSDSPNNVQIAQLLGQQLHAAGIDASVEEMEPSAFYERLNKGNFVLGVTGAYGGFAEDGLNFILASDGGGPATSTGWKGAPPTWKVLGGDAFTSAVNEALDRFQTDKPFLPLVGYGILTGSRVSDKVFSLTPLLYFRVASALEGH